MKSSGSRKIGQLHIGLYTALALNAVSPTMGAAQTAPSAQMQPERHAASAQPLPCTEDGDTPSFLTAASDIRYACGYLLKSRPPQPALAASNLRQALDKEPNNPDARLLLAVALAASGSRAEAREALVAAARVDGDARERLSGFLALHPELRTRVEGTLAPPRPDTPQTPDAPQRPNGGESDPSEATARVFRVGERVEVLYGPEKWVPGVVVSVSPGACPAYRVRHDPYGDGVQRELVYFCTTTRASTGMPPVRPSCGGSNRNCRPSAPPPLGSYVCHQTNWNVSTQRNEPIYHGYFELLPGNRYRWLDNGAVGTYRYDSTTHRIQWLSGHLQNRGRAEYGLDVATPEITITMDGGQQAGSRAPVWQCGLRRR
jgi:hypothetical protein